MRMNSLIFIIIYLLFNLFNKIKTKTVKENIINFVVIVSFIIISIIPSKIINNYYINKYDLDKSKTYLKKIQEEMVGIMKVLENKL